MYKQEQIKPYEGTGDKGKLVEEMFDNIAPTYDTLNHRLSWDIDKGWRKKAIKRLLPYAPKKMLDIATGTGDFAILAAQMLHPEQLVGADISEGMMEIGRQKVKRMGLDKVISFEKQDCLHLGYEDETFDAVTAALFFKDRSCFPNFGNTQRLHICGKRPFDIRRGSCYRKQRLGSFYENIYGGCGAGTALCAFVLPAVEAVC